VELEIHFAFVRVIESPNDEHDGASRASCEQVFRAEDAECPWPPAGAWRSRRSRCHDRAIGSDRAHGAFAGRGRFTPLRPGASARLRHPERSAGGRPKWKL